MPNNAVQTVEPEKLAAWMASGEAIVIDVREPGEFAAEHIAQAASVPLAELGRLGGDLELPQDRRIVFQCLVGGRGGQACAAAARQFPDRQIYNLAGGITGWKAAGYPVIARATQRAAFPSLFRQVQVAVGTILLVLMAVGFAGHAWGFALAALMSAMLVFAGLSGWCGMALVLQRMPWNRV